MTISYSPVNLLKYEICNSIVLWLKGKLVQSDFENSSYNVSSIICTYLCLQYAKPWPHSDIRSCCHRLLHTFTFSYNYILLAIIFYTEGVFG